MKSKSKCTLFKLSRWDRFKQFLIYDVLRIKRKTVNIKYKMGTLITNDEWISNLIDTMYDTSAVEDQTANASLFELDQKDYDPVRGSRRIVPFKHNTIKRNKS